MLLLYKLHPLILKLNRCRSAPKHCKIRLTESKCFATRRKTVGWNSPSPIIQSAYLLPPWQIPLHEGCHKAELSFNSRGLTGKEWPCWVPGFVLLTLTKAILAQRCTFDIYQGQHLSRNVFPEIPSTASRTAELLELLSKSCSNWDELFSS